MGRWQRSPSPKRPLAAYLSCSYHMALYRKCAFADLQIKGYNRKRSPSKLVM